jgi:hypothetical protein
VLRRRRALETKGTGDGGRGHIGVQLRRNQYEFDFWRLVVVFDVGLEHERLDERVEHQQFRVWVEHEQLGQRIRGRVELQLGLLLWIEWEQLRFVEWGLVQFEREQLQQLEFERLWKFERDS